MAIPRSIKQYLFQNGVSYVHKTDALAYTSQEIAQVEHVPGKQFAKTVVLRADGSLIMAVLPGDHVINMDVLKKTVGSRKLSLAAEHEFSDNFAACELGAMPPLGKLFGLPVYCDSALANLSEIEFNAGSHIDTIRIPYSTFVRLENPIVSSFSEPRTTHPVDRVA